MLRPTKEQTAIESAENLPLPEGRFETPGTAEAEKENLPAGEEKKPETEENLPRRPVSRRAVAPLPATLDPLAQKIEKILEENVGDAYELLSPIAKQEFKLKGEVVAQKISELLKSAHVKVKKVFQLILEWLKMLPGVNRFFLEQEAKIKTDRIIALHNKKL